MSVELWWRATKLTETYFQHSEPIVRQMSLLGAQLASIHDINFFRNREQSLLWDTLELGWNLVNCAI